MAKELRCFLWRPARRPHRVPCPSRFVGASVMSASQGPVIAKLVSASVPVAISGCVLAALPGSLVGAGDRGSLRQVQIAVVSILSSPGFLQSGKFVWMGLFRERLSDVGCDSGKRRS